MIDKLWDKLKFYEVIVFGSIIQLYKKRLKVKKFSIEYWLFIALHDEGVVDIFRKNLKQILKSYHINYLIKYFPT